MYIVIATDVILLALAAWYGFRKNRMGLAIGSFAAAVILTVAYSKLIGIVPPDVNLIDYLNPAKHVDENEYLSFWSRLFQTILSGFWARLIAVASLAGAFWFGVYRRRIAMGIFLFVLSVSAAYLPGILGLFRR